MGAFLFCCYYFMSFPCKCTISFVLTSIQEQTPKAMKPSSPKIVEMPQLSLAQEELRKTDADNVVTQKRRLSTPSLISSKLADTIHKEMKFVDLPKQHDSKTVATPAESDSFEPARKRRRFQRRNSKVASMLFPDLLESSPDKCDKLKVGQQPRHWVRVIGGHVILTDELLREIRRDCEVS